MILRIYNKDMALRHVLDCATQLSYELKSNDLSTCSFALPVAYARRLQLQAHEFVRFEDGGRDVGTYRIVSWDGGGKGAESFEVYQCEHAIATLLDSTMDGDHLFGGADMDTGAAAEYILSHQKVKHWVWGGCDFADHYEYAISNGDLLSALWSLGQVLVDAYQWVTDTTVYPWVVSLRRASTTVTAGLTYRRNLMGLSKKVDATKLITRLYPKGNGEGVNQLTIASVNGGVPYIEAAPEIMDLYGIKEGQYPVSDIEDAALLLAKGKAVLEQLCRPVYTYTAEAADIYRFTGLQWDDLQEGALIRVYDAEESLDLVTRIVSLRKENVGGDPARMTATLSTASTDLISDINSIADRVAIQELYSQGTTQMYPLQLADNADPEHPLVLRYYVPPEAKHINKVICAWELEAFRAYSTSASAGGGQGTTTAFGGSTTVATWVEGYSYNVDTAAAFVTTSEASGSGTDHTHTAYHWHTVPISVNIPQIDIVIPEHNHTMTIPYHSHGISYGIYEGGTAQSVTVRVDGADLPADALSDGQVDVAPYMSADDDGKIQRGTWHTIEIIPDALTRIVGNLYMQIFIQHRGGGSF